MVGDITTSNVDALDSRANGESLKHWRAVANAIATVKNYTRSFSLRVQTEYCLGLEENTWRLELFEEELCGLLAVCERIQRGLSQENRVFLRRDLKQVEDVSPESFHILHVYDNSMLDGIAKFQGTSVLLDVITDVNILAVGRNHNLFILGTTNALANLNTRYSKLTRS